MRSRVGWPHRARRGEHRAETAAVDGHQDAARHRRRERGSSISSVVLAPRAALIAALRTIVNSHARGCSGQRAGRDRPVRIQERLLDDILGKTHVLAQLPHSEPRELAPVR